MSEEVLIEAYRRRRDACMKQMGHDAVAIVFGQVESPRNNDTHYPFRQHSDFHYLSGISEPDAVMVFCPGRATGETILFSAEKDPKVEQWIGPRVGVEKAIEFYHFDEAFPLSKLDEMLPKLFQDKAKLYLDFTMFKRRSDDVFKWLETVNKQVRSGINAPTELCDLSVIIHEMRLIKDEFELALMKRACDISVEAHIDAMRATRIGMKEYEIESVILNRFVKEGARQPAYESIVAGGANACVLHYVNNRDELKDGDLLLIDAGCEYQCYAADITRTFPINGKFTEAQKKLYNLVLASQEAAIALVKPGVAWHALQETIVSVLVEGLIDLGILDGNMHDLIESRAYEKYYMHKSGHWLGLDVHDVGRYKINKQFRTLEENMVFTIEPGLYLPNDESIAAEWRGVGIRIEDDIAVTRVGADIMTRGVPKSIDDIEQLMG